MNLLKPVALAIVVAVVSPVHQTHAQLLQYTFNDIGTTAANTGSATASNLTFENSAGTATDLHSPAGGGVSSQAGDLSFLNQATGQGSAGTGGAAFNTGITALNGLGALTLTGWYNTATAPFGSGARLAISSSQNLSLNFNTASLALLLTTTGTSNTVTTTNSIANTANSWVFFAATYDGATLRLYLGNTTTAAASVANVGATGNTNFGNGLYLGNVAGLNRPFNGSMDDFRAYNTALTAAQIQAVQAGDLANVPEPSTWAVMSFGVAAVGVAWRRRRQAA